MISFKQSDLDELRNSCNYLSDVIIEFYFSYLSSIFRSDVILFVPPTISFLLANSKDEKDIADCVKPLELHTKDLVFFPVNNGGVHWSLLVYNREFNVFAHHDSLSGLNDSEARDLFVAVKSCVHETEGLRYRIEFRNKRRHMDGSCDEAMYFRAPTPRQKNGYDCGLYVMAMAKAICGWFCSGVREEDWLRETEKIDDNVVIRMRPLVLGLIRVASEGRLGSVSCTIEKEKERPGADIFEGLNEEEIEHDLFWENLDFMTSGDELPISSDVGKIVADDSPSLIKEDTNNGKMPLINEEVISDSEKVERFMSCESTSAASSVGVNNLVNDISIVEENKDVNVSQMVEHGGSGLKTEDMESMIGTTSTMSDCRTSAFSSEYLTQWPPEERSAVSREYLTQWPPEER